MIRPQAITPKGCYDRSQAGPLLLFEGLIKFPEAVGYGFHIVLQSGFKVTSYVNVCIMTLSNWFAAYIIAVANKCLF